MRILLVIALLPMLIAPASAQERSLAERLKGRILLQVEQKGEAWYVHPGDLRRRYLGRPADAFAIMRGLGIGITDQDLEKIAPGTLDQDSDGDGYSDRMEIENGYDPFLAADIKRDPVFTARHLGKIFLQAEKKGEAWYVSPADQKRYYLGRPDDAFAIMRSLGLGIKDSDLAWIPQAAAPVQQEPAPYIPPTDQSTGSRSVMDAAAAAIRANDKSEAVKYFDPSLAKRVEYTLDALDADGRLQFGNALSGASKESGDGDTDAYSINLYFSLGGYSTPAKFEVKKQPDGTWLITNL